MTMQYEVERWLRSTARDIAPCADERAVARDAHRLVRDLLATGEMDRRINRSYLSGSYVRHTATSPLNDIDIVFEIDPGRWRRPFRLFDDGLPTPDQVIETFARAARSRLRGIGDDETRVRRQGCSVGVMFDDVHVDIVPAVANEGEDDDDDDEWYDDAIDAETEHEDLVDWECSAASDRVLIPNRRAGEWVESNPRAHTRVAAALNNESGGLFKPTVRLLKTWNDRIGAPVGSFVIETIAGHVFAVAEVETLTEAMWTIWDTIAVCGGRDGGHAVAAAGVNLRDGFFSSLALPDLAGIGDLGPTLDADEAQQLVDQSTVASDQLASACRARTDGAVDRRLDKLIGVTLG